MKSYLPKQTNRLHPVHRRLEELGGRRHGYTIKWLAVQSGVTPQTISAYMRGSEINLWNKSRLLKALNVPEAYLYSVGEYARPVR